MNSPLLSLVDTHAHLCNPEFEHDLTDVLYRAQRAGVGAVIAVGETLEDADRTLALAKSHPMIRPAAGLYPTVLDTDHAAAMVEFIRRHRLELAAIGEVCLDYWAVKEEAARELQREIFKGFNGSPLSIS